jgi:hypothetical protein
MDSESLKEKYEKDIRDRYAQKQPKIAMLKLRLKKPTLKDLLGQNPIQDEEFGDLDKYFRLSRGSR